MAAEPVSTDQETKASDGGCQSSRYTCLEDRLHRWTARSVKLWNWSV